MDDGRDSAATGPRGGSGHHDDQVGAGGQIARRERAAKRAELLGSDEEGRAPMAVTGPARGEARGRLGKRTGVEEPGALPGRIRVIQTGVGCLGRNQKRAEECGNDDPHRGQARR